MCNTESDIILISKLNIISKIMMHQNQFDFGLKNYEILN